MNLVFISSPQNEFAQLRRELCYFILTDPYLSRYFNVFLFENLPANQRSPEHNYLEKIVESTIYLGLFGNTYGSLDKNGLSATEREFDFATTLGKDRLIFCKRLSDKSRQANKMEALVEKAKQVLTLRSFQSIADAKLEVMRSLLLWQQESSAN